MALDLCYIIGAVGIGAQTRRRVEAVKLATSEADSVPAERIIPQPAGKQQDYLVFVWTPAHRPYSEPDVNFELSTWRPSLTKIVPPGLHIRYSLWWLANYLRVLHNKDYCVFMAMDGNRVVHRSCVIPSYFRWPFMNPADVQISSTWTDPNSRGKGLATDVLRCIVNRMQRKDRCFWYVTRAENLGSIAVCKKAGFSYYGRATRRSRFGIRLLGQLVIEELADNESLVSYGR